MDWIIPSLTVAAWLWCGVLAFRLDRKDYPEPVVPVADALLSAVLLLAGPIGLAALLFMRRADQ